MPEHSNRFNRPESQAGRPAAVAVNYTRTQEEYPWTEESS